MGDSAEKKMVVAKKMIKITKEFDREHKTDILRFLEHELRGQKWLR